jgi:hypothetical protein
LGSNQKTGTFTWKIGSGEPETESPTGVLPGFFKHKEESKKNALKEEGDIIVSL